MSASSQTILSIANHDQCAFRQFGFAPYAYMPWRQNCQQALLDQGSQIRKKA